MVHSVAIWYDVLTSREIFDNKGGKWCILSLFDTMFWPPEKILKTRAVNGAFWRVLRPKVDDFGGALDPLVILQEM